jgi:hypothetical protein
VVYICCYLLINLLVLLGRQKITQKDVKNAFILNLEQSSTLLPKNLRSLQLAFRTLDERKQIKPKLNINELNISNQILSIYEI